MFGLSGSELLLYGGLCIMAGTLLTALISVVVFIRAGKKLKEKLSQEYGNLQE